MMAKQRIQKLQRSEIERQVQLKTVETAAEIISKYVKTWARKEIVQLIHDNKIPVLLPTRSGILVGKYLIIKFNGIWELRNDYNERLQVFYDKRSAVLYSIMYSRNWFKSASEILIKDNALGKLEVELTYYTASMKRAVNNKDYSKVDIIASRYYDAVQAVKLAKNDLEKTLKLNKYLKIWETGYHYET